MKAIASIFVAALLAAPGRAQFVEVTARLHITNWQYQAETGLPLRDIQNVLVRCVASTNHWLVEHRARTNATDATWFLNGKIIRQITYDDPAPTDGTTFRTFRRNSRPASVMEGADGYPGGELLVNVAWFAFCSGPYLRSSPRGVPVPTAAPGRMAFGFTNETAFFSDRFGLPRRAVFYAPPRQVQCDYEVQQSTNVLGWNFPMTFLVVQNEPDSFGKWNRQLAIAGRVISIHPTAPIELPEELQEWLEYREQFPTRRRGTNAPVRR